MAELAVPSEVMLTLTRENLAQVIPLGELLRNRTGSFTFNRLALFGKGADLALPERDDYAAFLSDYLVAMRDNPVLALKDSLFNIALENENRGLFDGCAGYGCGAAFNFVAFFLMERYMPAENFLPLSGHSTKGTCPKYITRKLLLPTGKEAHPAGGAGCGAVCRGCPAVTASFAGNPLKDRDPFCFRNHRKPKGLIRDCLFSIFSFLLANSSSNTSPSRAAHCSASLRVLPVPLAKHSSSAMTVTVKQRL